MKKLLALLAICSFIFSCDNNGNTGGQDYTDSTKYLVIPLDKDEEMDMDLTKICKITVNLPKWKITNAEGDSMIAHYICDTCDAEHNSAHIKRYRNRVYSKLECLYGRENVMWVNARYRAYDTIRYRGVRGMAETAKEGGVKDYNTWIIRVVVSHRFSFADVIEYYDCVSICPPPKDACPAYNSHDSSGHHTDSGA